jgi:hypothetical protein
VKETVRWSQALGAAICGRVAGGEVLYAVLREDGMPTAQSVARWAREKPAFGAALEAARRAGGRGPEGGGVWSYCAETADAIFERLCEGESLTAIAADPTMPCMSTIFYWRDRIAGFEGRMQLAMRIRAERFCDLGWELAMGATPETAYLTHVRLTQLRWTAGAMAPRVFRTRTVEPEAPQKDVKVLFRQFRIETDPATGKDKVVAYCPNPFTGQAEREDEPGWRPPGGAECVPMPGGRGGR